MKRDKAWWGRLSKAERAELMVLQMAPRHGCGSAYLPEGYAECRHCSWPCSGGGLCPVCDNRMAELERKADG